MLLQLITILVMLVTPPSDELKELLPGIDVGDGVVEFDGTIAIDCHHPDTPNVFLEMLVTAPDSREHESLVVSSIKPSLLHAALLAAGFESGSPLTRDADGNRLPASGDRVRVFVAVVIDGVPPEPDAFVPIESWAVHVESDESLDNAQSWTGLVFAGSQLTKKGYAADRGGTLISLTSFGDEVIAPTWLVSAQATVDEPVWIARRDLVPEQGTPIRVRIEGVEQSKEESHEPEGIDIDRDP